MKRKRTPYRLGQSLIVTVDKVFPFGLFVCLDGETRGYIRRRELSYAAHADPQHDFTTGDKIAAIIISLASETHDTELSHIKTLADPWKTRIGDYEVGQVIRATVIRLRLAGAFVEIQPGLPGICRKI